MFGPPMRIKLDGYSVTLRPPLKEEMAELVETFSSLQTHMYTMRTFAVTKEDEEDWYEKVRKDASSCQWAIVPEDSTGIVGFTGLNSIDPIGMSCTSGIIIAYPEYRGKGIASRTHLARTLFAADYLNRFTIQSRVRVPNEASFKALLRVGYMITGKWSANWYRNGEFVDTYVLSWLNPDRVSLTRPKGLNDDEKKAVRQAREALDIAKKSVQLL